jgi:hypothetical protein
MKKLIVETDIIQFHNELNKIVNEYCDKAWDSQEGGKRRKIMGDLGEKISHKIFEFCLNHLKIINSIVYSGTEKKILCKINDHAYFYAQVDKHVEILNELTMICEAKTYLDKPYIERANADFSLIKKYNTIGNKKIFSCIISLQDSIKKETLSFFMMDGHINDVFILMDNKRSSKKPIWNPNFRKNINFDKLYQCIFTIIENMTNEI